MKCFTWERGQLTPGIQVERDDSLGMVVSLGENGRGGGRSHEKVELFRTPPEIKEGVIFDAHPVKITTDLEDLRQDKYFYRLAKPTEPDHRFIVRILTKWTHACRTHGRWRTIKGSPDDLVVGCGAAPGRVIPRNSTWHDGLVLFAPGDVVLVRPEGGHDIERYVLFCDEDGMHDMSFREYKSKFATVINEEFI